MKGSTLSDEEQLIAKAVAILMEQLGPTEAGRFLTLPRKKRLESVQRHCHWQARLHQEPFFNRVFGAG